MSDFDAVSAARMLVREARYGALATLGDAGAPYASLVAVAADPAGVPLILISRLARHTANLERDPRASLLLTEEGTGDPLACARISLDVKAMRDDSEAARRHFLARHPEAEGYAAFADFSFWRLLPSQGHLVAGFGRIVDLAANDLLLATGPGGEG